MAKVCWLHISDVHILRVTDTPGAEAFNQERVLDRFVDFMANHFPYGRIEKPQYLFITGDLAFRGKKEDYEDSHRYSVRTMIDAVAHVMGIKDSEYRERVFPVAGNHDADRDTLYDRGMEEAYLQDAGDVDRLNDLFRNSAKQDRKDRVHQRFGAYCDFVRNLWNDTDCSNEDVLWYSKSSPVNGSGQQVHVIGLNSAWLCHSHWFTNMKGTDRENKTEPTSDLTIPETLWTRLCATIPDDAVTIALMHHDYEMTRDRATSLPSCLENKCDFVLCGHEHRDTWAHPSLPRAYKVRAGNFYLRRDHRNAVNIIEVDLDDQTGKMLTVQYRTDNGGKWAVDRDSDPTAGKGTPQYSFDPATGLFSFVLRRDPSRSLPPRPPIKEWQRKSEELRIQIVEASKTGRFDGCFGRAVLLEHLHKLGMAAGEALSFAKSTVNDVQLRNEAIVKLCDYIKHTMHLDLPGERDIWRHHLDEINKSDMSPLSAPLMWHLGEILAYRESPESNRDDRLPGRIYTALLGIYHNTERIIDYLTSVQKDGMGKAHDGLSEMATDIGPLPPAQSPSPPPIRIDAINGRGKHGDDPESSSHDNGGSMTASARGEES